MSRLSKNEIFKTQLSHVLLSKFGLLALKIIFFFVMYSLKNSIERKQRLLKNSQLQVKKLREDT